MKFHSPYQFINIRPAKATISYKTSKKTKQIDGEHVRHDYWADDGHSGKIICTLTTQSPLVIGAKQDPADKDGNYPATVHPYKHPDGKIALPANSLRGMIGSLAENISQSSMRVLSKKLDSAYSVRQNVGDSTQKMGLLLKNEQGVFRLYQLRDSNGNLSSATMLSNNDASNKSTYQHNAEYKKSYFAKISNGRESHATEISETKSSNKIEGVVYKRGIATFFKKSHESFIPWDGQIPEESIDVSVLVAKFQTTLLQYADNDNFKKSFPIGYGYKNNKGVWEPRVCSGDLVYYKEDNNNQITELSYSQIWRKPVEGDLHQAIEQEYGIDTLPWHKRRDNLTPVEAIFGVVETDFNEENGARNLASRIRFTDATPTNGITLEDVTAVILKILDSPKPPSPSMYFQNNNENKKLVSKKALNLTKNKPNGRKHYLPHTKQLHEKENRENWETKFTDENPPTKDKSTTPNWKQYLKVTPIPMASRFTFDIHFENLNDAELGLLLTTLEPNNEGKTFIHKLGLGKPLGLGEVKLKIETVEANNKSDNYSFDKLETVVKNNTLSAEKILSIKNIAKSEGYINEETLNELKTLYNPENIKHSVCYPYSSPDNQHAGEEGEGFKWFSRNDRLSQESLVPIEAEKNIPELDSFEDHHF